jgi:hypothetical protein
MRVFALKANCQQLTDQSRLVADSTRRLHKLHSAFRRQRPFSTDSAGVPDSELALEGL